jgi:hypothetical protein
VPASHGHNLTMTRSVIEGFSEKPAGPGSRRRGALGGDAGQCSSDWSARRFSYGLISRGFVNPAAGRPGGRDRPHAPGPDRPCRPAADWSEPGPDADPVRGNPGSGAARGRVWWVGAKRARGGGRHRPAEAQRLRRPDSIPAALPLGLGTSQGNSSLNRADPSYRKTSLIRLSRRTGEAVSSCTRGFNLLWAVEPRQPCR